MKRRVLSFLVGHPGLRRRATMPLMRLLRGRRLLSRPQLRFVRTLQLPDQVVYNAGLQRWEPSSAAFSPSSTDGSLSGDLEELLRADGLPPQTLYPAVPRAVGAATFTIQQARDLGVQVRHDPVWSNWYHGGALFPGTGRNQLKRALKSVAQELIAIDAAEALQSYRDRHGGQKPQGHP
jgi:hypothetical protein